MENIDKWQEDYLAKIALMTNEEILDEYTTLANADDYDGCFTKASIWKFGKVKNIFYTRLRQCGFLDIELKRINTVKKK